MCPPCVHHVSTMCPPRSSEQIRPMPWQTRWLGKGRWITGAGHREISSCSRAETSPECICPLLYGEFSKNLDSRWVFGSWHRYGKTWLIQNDLPKTSKNPKFVQHLSKWIQPDIQRSQESPRSLGLLALHRVSATRLGGYSSVKSCNYSQPAAWVWFSSRIPGGHTKAYVVALFEVSQLRLMHKNILRKPDNSELSTRCDPHCR